MIPPPLLFINIKYILLLFFHPYNSPPPISYHCRLFSCGPTLHYHRPTPTPPSPLLSSTLTSLPYHLLSTLTPPPPIYIRQQQLRRLSTPLVSIANTSSPVSYTRSHLLTLPLRFISPPPLSSQSASSPHHLPPNLALSIHIPIVMVDPRL